jgi:Tfp pilus assembly protein FimV
LFQISTEKATLEAREQELTSKLEEAQQELAAKCAELEELMGKFEALEEQYNVSGASNHKCHRSSIVEVKHAFLILISLSLNTF